MAKVVVVGLGPAGPDLVTEQVRHLLEGKEHPVLLRTVRHPAATLAEGASSCDDLYDDADRIEDVYVRIVERVVDRATAAGTLVYAVPGSPVVAESTVEALQVDARVEVEVLPAMSFLDLLWVRLGVDPFAVSPRIVDGRRFAEEAAGQRGPLLVAQCDALWVLSDIKLAYEDGAPEAVTIVQRLGLPDERIVTVPWEDLDRTVEPDHLTSLWIPRVGAPVAMELQRVEEVARRLRRECPWDREQTHASLQRYLVEEAYELVDAIEDLEAGVGTQEDEDPDIDFIEELGDVLFQVFAHAAIAAEEGRFTVADVARTVADKLIERHPHVYGDVEAATSDAVMATWEANKMASKGRTSVMEGIPRSLPALQYAAKVLKRADHAGVVLDAADVDGRGLGGALLVLVDRARAADEDPEAALRRVVDAFRERVEAIEAAEPAARR